MVAVFPKQLRIISGSFWLTPSKYRQTVASIFFATVGVPGTTEKARTLRDKRIVEEAAATIRDNAHLLVNNDMMEPHSL